jgi:hypothetical protein
MNVHRGFASRQCLRQPSKDGGDQNHFGSFRRGRAFELGVRDNFVSQHFKPRITAERIKHGINSDPGRVDVVCSRYSRGANQ